MTSPLTATSLENSPTFDDHFGNWGSSPSASGAFDWFNFFAGIPAEDRAPPALPTPSVGDKPVRILTRRIAGQPQAPATDMSAPAASLAPSDDPKFSGGLLGRLAALADIDPQNTT